jgi:hypothetical protein
MQADHAGQAREIRLPHGSADARNAAAPRERGREIGQMAASNP